MKQKLIDIASKEFAEVWNIMQDSFPDDERRSLDQQKEIFQNKNYSLLAFSEDGILGIAGIWKLDDFIFVEHLAVKRKERGRGHGTGMLNALKDSRNKIILEMEVPKTRIQKRRASFYSKAGFIINQFPYKQPAYSEDKNPVDCLILSYPEKIQDDEFARIRKILYREVYQLKNTL